MKRKTRAGSESIPSRSAMMNGICPWATAPRLNWIDAAQRVMMITHPPPNSTRALTATLVLLLLPDTVHHTPGRYYRSGVGPISSAAALVVHDHVII